MRIFSVGVLSLLLGASGFARAETPSKVLVGSVANSWVQAGLRVTSGFDMAIQGHGFFALRTSDGETIYTRSGVFALDADGYVIHKHLGGRLLGVPCDAKAKPGIAPVALGGAARRGAGVLKGFRIDYDGSIVGVYSDGHVYPLACIGIAVFQNSRKLRQVAEHGFSATADSGEAYVDRAKFETRGEIYMATLEELDGEIYAASLD